MHVLGMSILLSMSSSSFAELIMDASGGTAQAALNWSSEDAKQLLNGDVSSLNDEATPQGSTKITTSVRSSNAVVSHAAPKTVQILNNSRYSNQPAVNARAALVMDSQTGEVLYSKNTNAALPIASITKLMTAVVIADARLNMSEDITLQAVDLAGAKEEYKGEEEIHDC